MTDHTPTPWRAEIGRVLPDSEAFGFAIRSEYTHPNLPASFLMHSIASANIYEHTAFTACFSPEEIEANAAFIVKAVNNHEALVKALRLARARIEYLGIVHPALTHFEANEKTFLPAIDEVLNGPVGGPPSDFPTLTTG